MESERSILDILISYEKVLISKNISVVKYLQPGKCVYEIIQIFNSIGIHCPEELVTLYTWKNGVDSNDSFKIEAQIYPDLALLSTEEAIDAYHVYHKYNDLWDINWVPIFKNAGGDYYLADINIENGHTCKIRSSTKHYEYVPIVANSLLELFHTMLLIFSDNYILVNDQGMFEFYKDNYNPLDHLEEMLRLFYEL